MPKTLFLASRYLTALPSVLDEDPAILQLLYIPTAANVEDFSPDSRRPLEEMGFQIDELDLATASRARVEQAVMAADVIQVCGGNTYYLLQEINRSGFREFLSQRDDVVYSGDSAGAVVACNDIAYIKDLDDPKKAPELTSTTGLGLVSFPIMPHIDNVDFAPAIAQLSLAEDVVRLRDDQALVVRNGRREVVAST